MYNPGIMSARNVNFENLKTPFEATSSTGFDNYGSQRASARRLNPKKRRTRSKEKKV